MNHTRLIIVREYVTQVKNKKFLLMTLLTPLLLAGLSIFIFYLMSVNDDSIKNITVVDNSGVFENSLLSSETIEFSFLQDLDEEEAKLTSKERNDYGLIFIPEIKNTTNIDYVALSESIKFISEDAPSIPMITTIENKLERILTNLNYVSIGLDLNKIEESKIYLSLFQESFDGEETTKIDGLVKVVFGLILGMLLYMFVFIYGAISFEVF